MISRIQDRGVCVPALHALVAVLLISTPLFSAVPEKLLARSGVLETISETQLILDVNGPKGIQKLSFAINKGANLNNPHPGDTIDIIYAHRKPMDVAVEVMVLRRAGSPPPPPGAAVPTKGNAPAEPLGVGALKDGPLPDQQSEQIMASVGVIQPVTETDVQLAKLQDAERMSTRGIATKSTMKASSANASYSAANRASVKTAGQSSTMASSSSAQTASAQAAPTTSQVSSIAADSPYPATAAAQTPASTSATAGAAKAMPAPGAAGNSKSTYASATHPLSNDDIVQLTKAGLSQATIIWYIQNYSESIHFDLNAAGLSSLRTSGVSEPVIAAMKKRAGVSN